MTSPPYLYPATTTSPRRGGAGRSRPGEPVMAIGGFNGTDHVTGIEVTGFARPQDIGPNNTLDSSQLAEANIQYVGIGDVNSAHHVPWLESTLSKYSPF